jgi:hypothetical protein
MDMTDSAPRSERAPVEYDIHGLVGIRLVGASRSDAAAVDRQLGPCRGELAREADLTIRFVDRVRCPEGLRLLGQGDSAFTDDLFVLFHGRGRSMKRTIFPFSRIGDPCEIVCESGISSVPLLIAAINLTMLARGIVALHASAVEYEGSGVLATGWSKGGKTETLLALAANGGRYIGDEWVYLSADGDMMYGLPQPIRVWDWHLEQLPQFRSALPRAARARISALKRLVNALEGRPWHRSVAPAERAGALGKALEMLRRQLGADVSTKSLFGDNSRPARCSFDHLLFVGCHESPRVTVVSADPGEVASRMAASLQYERLPFLRCYHKFRFAFPNARNPLVERAEEMERAGLQRALRGKPAHAVRHPYPIPIADLYRALVPLLDGSGRSLDSAKEYPGCEEESALATV